MSTLEESQTNAPQIEGRLDAVEGNRVFGWAWDRARPGERVTVELRAEGGRTLIATVTADRERADLLANGIGDGFHAFEAELETAAPADLEIHVRLDGQNGAIPLTRRSEIEIATEAAVAPGLRRLLDSLEGLGARQRDLMAGQQAIVRLIRTNPRGEPVSVNTGQIETMLERLSDRMEVFETFLMRFDERLRRLEEIDAERAVPQEKRPLRRLFPRKEAVS